MSKFKIKMKLQGLELEIEGAREDSSNIGRNLGGQLANLLQPAIKIIDGEASSAALPPAEAVLPPASPRKSPPSEVSCEFTSFGRGCDDSY